MTKRYAWSSRETNPKIQYKTEMKETSMQWPRTEAIRSKIRPSKPKRELTKITSCQNTKENIWSTELMNLSYMSRVMRKPAFCICENKDADQLRGYREADQRLCFRYTDITIPLPPIYEISSLKTSCVVVQPGLCRIWSETPKTGFLTTRLIFLSIAASASTLTLDSLVGFVQHLYG